MSCCQPLRRILPGGPSHCAVAAVLGASSLALQGCELNIPRHVIGNWRTKDNYLTKYEYVNPAPAGSNLRDTKTLNSCAKNVNNARSTPQTLQCSGHGVCRDWNPSTPQDFIYSAPRLEFCRCDRDWADPECRTARKSQMAAFVFSMFLGFFGVDEFYLGHVTCGLVKLVFGLFGALCIFDIIKSLNKVPREAKYVVLGACCLWWLFDIVRIGSTPVFSHSRFRVARDLPHFAFVLVVVVFAALLGFIFSFYSIGHVRMRAAHETMLLRLEQYHPKKRANNQPEENHGSIPHYGSHTAHHSVKGMPKGSGKGMAHPPDVHPAVSSATGPGNHPPSLHHAAASSGYLPSGPFQGYGSTIGR